MSVSRGGSRTAATSKMERFVIIVNGFQPLTIVRKRSILDVVAALDPPLVRGSSVYLEKYRIMTFAYLKYLIHEFTLLAKKY